MWRIRRDQRQKLLGRDHLVNRQPALKPPRAASGTAHGPAKMGIGNAVHLAEPGVVGMRFFALGAETTHEPLGGDQAQRRGQ